MMSSYSCDNGKAYDVIDVRFLRKKGAKFNLYYTTNNVVQRDVGVHFFDCMW